VKNLAPIACLVLFACGSSSSDPGDAGDASTSPDSSTPHADAASDSGPTDHDAAPNADASSEDASSTDGGTKDTGASDTGPGSVPCSDVSDCRLYPNQCNTCWCQPLRKDWTDPVCPGQPVTCLVDPCQGKQVACDNGQCTVH
jgi:hypothetical protein